MRKKNLMFALIIGFIMAGFPTMGKAIDGTAEDLRWRATLMTATAVQAPLQDVIEFNTPPMDEFWLTSVSVSWEFAQIPRWVGFGVEAQVVKLWEAADAFEWNPVLLIRWYHLPWNKLVPSSFALGNGISYSTRVPGMEHKHFAVVARTLYYILLEFTFGIPRTKNWDLVLRVHHRSGIFGLFGENLKAGSNYLGAGVAWRF